MDLEKSMPTFVAFTDKDALVFINLRHIALLHDRREESITLEMSNGKTITIHGQPAVAMLPGHLIDQTALLGGGSLAEILRKMDATNSSNE
jgi:hypothetical protein